MAVVVVVVVLVAAAAVIWSKEKLRQVEEMWVGEQH